MRPEGDHVIMIRLISLRGQRRRTRATHEQNMHSGRRRCIIMRMMRPERQWARIEIWRRFNKMMLMFLLAPLFSGFLSFSKQVSLTPAAQCRAGCEPCDERRLAEQKSPVLAAQTTQPA